MPTSMEHGEKNYVQWNTLIYAFEWHRMLAVKSFAFFNVRIYAIRESLRHEMW